MASRIPGYEDSQRNGNDTNAVKPCNSGGQSRGDHLATDGDGCIGDEGAEPDDDDQDNSVWVKNEHVGAPQAQKKRKPKKKKKAKSALIKQTTPPRVSLDDLFPTGAYPKGELQSYTSSHVSAIERRLDARIEQQDDEFFKNYRKAAEAHRTARKWVQDTVKPGQSLLSIAKGIEDSVRAVLGHAGLENGDSLKAGLGFPTGLCINHQVAHYTPYPGQKEVILQQSDTMKVDFGVHINGWIVDSAFTMAFDAKHDQLLAAVKAATNAGIKASGIDVRICEVSEAIQETMESYEVEYHGKTFPIKPVRNITAHNIEQWHIHGGKSIPFVKNSDQTKMEEGEIFAIETFGTTGRGYIRDDTGIYGYGLNTNAPLSIDLPMASAKRVHKTIRDNFSTIVFCRRYLDRLGIDKYLAGLNCLVNYGIVETYAPLTDVPGSYSAQFEHTLILRENHKEVLSHGEDY